MKTGGPRRFKVNLFVPSQGGAGESDSPAIGVSAGRGSRRCFTAARGFQMVIKATRKSGPYIMESLILAQNERWRRVLRMQVERHTL